MTTDYVRSASEAERIVSGDRRVVLAMRFDANGIGRRAAQTLLEIRRRGYVIGWDAVVAFVQMAGPVLDRTPAHLASLIIADSGMAIPEEGRAALVAEYAEMSKYLDPDEEAPGDRRMRQLRYFGMKNRAMRDKLERGEAVDLSACPRSDVDHCYIIPADVWQEGVDYCDADAEAWIWSIGRMHATGEIRAARDGRFYQNDACECLWLR